MKQKVVAGIDLGTNACRLLVVDLSGALVYKDTTSVRLGKGMNEAGYFTDETIERAVVMFKKYSKKLKEYDVLAFRTVATAACREAKNSAEFIKKIYEESGIAIEVIDAFEETRLTLKGAISHVLGKSKYVLNFDIGGGSTEITLAENNFKMKILGTISIPLGSRNSAEKFGINDYDEKAALSLANEVKRYVNRFVQEVDFKKYCEDCICVATAGTALRLAAFVRDKGEYDREATDGKTVSVKDVDVVVEKIFKMSFEERKENPYISDRPDVMVAGCIIFKTIYDGLNLKEITASLRSAKEGIVWDLLDGKVNKIS
jgi:exopolyphosphatase/guanosine-5'-triphosphate,3'-diphosphate pyrophosphatase